MNFTKFLVALFIIVIFVANVEGTSEVKLSCEKKCKLLCILNPFCMDGCLKDCHHSISIKKAQLNIVPNLNKMRS
ncbi:hypothetical protein P3S67_023013 [Capsicum chacoense]